MSNKFVSSANNFVAIVDCNDKIYIIDEINNKKIQCLSYDVINNIDQIFFHEHGIFILSERKLYNQPYFIHVDNHTHLRDIIEMHPFKIDSNGCLYFLCNNNNIYIPNGQNM